MPLTRNCLTTLISDEDYPLVYSMTASDLDSRVKGSGLGHNSHDLKSLKFLKRWMGWVGCWEDFKVICALTQESRQGGTYTPTPFVPGNNFPELGASCELSHMTYRWEECTHSGLLSCHDNSGRKQLLSPYYR